MIYENKMHIYPALFALDLVLQAEHFLWFSLYHLKHLYSSEVLFIFPECLCGTIQFFHIFKE